MRQHASSRYRKLPWKTRIQFYTDLSQIEEQKDTHFLHLIGRQAAINALNENKALGIPVTFWQDGQVVTRHGDGSITIVQRSSHSSVHTPARRVFKKGTVIHIIK
jgi:hypothetical protein